ncbi:MAG: hypothetical protein WA817_24590 [Candidatus Acidiferrum sp.]
MIRCAAVLILFVFALGASAQTPPQHQHTLTVPNLIDGAVHPELIPDSLAYRLYLLTMATGPNPTESEQMRQHVHIMRTGLLDTDQRTLIDILSDFRSRYDALVNEYNSSAMAANARSESTDAQPLLRKLDDLVQSTRDSISARLSTQGAAKLHAFVVSEKKNMKITGGNQ